MRNLYGIVSRLSCITSHTLTRHTGNCLLQEFATGHKIPLRRHRSMKLSPQLSESAELGIEILQSDKRQRISYGHTLYVMDELVAKKFASLVITNRMKNSSHVIEMNPGLGFLTKELLDAGIPFINMYEGIENFIPKLNSLGEKYQGRFHLEMMDFYKLWNMSYADLKNNTDKFSSYFDQVTKRSWKDEHAIEIIGSLADRDFIHRLVNTFVYKQFISKYGRIVIYVAIPPSIFAMLTCTNDHYDLYRARIILFQTFFSCELLGSLPRKAFFPSYRSSTLKPRTVVRQNIRKNDYSVMNVVRIESRLDLFDTSFTEDDIIPYSFFIKHHLRARSNRVIPGLEHWIPDCGRILIAQGYNIFTEFGELTPPEILKLFKQFRSWPEYKMSTFASCADAILSKIDERFLFDENSDKMEYVLPDNQDETLTK